MPKHFLTTILLAGLAFAGNHSSSIERRCRDALDAALSDSNPDVRREAILALSLGGPYDLFLSRLESGLSDKDVRVRLATVAGLAEWNNKRTVAALEKALQDEVPEVSFAAAKALWGLKQPAGKEALLSVLSGETKPASGVLTTEVRDAMRMMHTPKTMFLFAVRQGIGFVPVPGLAEGVASMEGLLADPGTSGRASAALLLGRARTPRIREALVAALGDKDWSVRAAAVHSLALWNEPGLQDKFVPLLDDTKEGVRLRAASGYLRLALLRKARTRKAQSLRSPEARPAPR